MKRSLLVVTTVLVGALFVIWLIDSKNIDQVAAAFHPSPAGPVSHGNPEGAPLDSASIHLVESGRTEVPGKLIAPQVKPRLVLPPKFPAEAAMPAELLQAQKLSTMPSPLQSFPSTFEGRMGKLNLFSQTNALPPPTSAPPEMQMLRNAMSPANTPARPTPTVKELRDQMLTLPDGREVIEEAKRRGARISRQTLDSNPSFFASLSPFAVSDVQAAQSFSATYTPKDPKNSALTFSGIWLWDPYKPVLDATIHTGGPQGKSYAVFNVNVPKDGWYWVNVVAYVIQVKATLVKAGTSITSWDYGPVSGVRAYPALVELAAGSHTFYWFVDRGTAEFQEVSVQSDQ